MTDEHEARTAAGLDPKREKCCHKTVLVRCSDCPYSDEEVKRANAHNHRTTNTELLAAMEPTAANASVDTLEQRGLSAVAMISAAISLKRIADAVTTGGLHIDITVPPETAAAIQHLAWEAGCNFKSGNS